MKVLMFLIEVPIRFTLALAGICAWWMEWLGGHNLAFTESYRRYTLAVVAGSVAST
jgi:hypothetical protein